MEIQNSQNSIQNYINELSYLLTVTGKRGPHVSGSACQRQRSRARCQVRWRPAELADGEDFGDTKATYMIYVMRWFDWCYQLELRPSGGSLSSVMAARQSSGASCRQRQATAGSTEHGMSYRRSPQCYPSKEKRRGGFLATPTAAASTLARARSWRR